MPDLAHLLPTNATAWEVAQSLTSAARRPVPADLIRTVWNPDTCPADLLDILANALSVDVWSTDWDEVKKRRVIKRAIPVQRVKGTLAAIREYAGYRDAEVVSVVRPPQRFFAGAAETPETRAAWVASLPQIRLYTERSKIAREPRIIAGGSKPFFLSGRFAMPTTAPVRAGERAVLWRAGVETTLGVGFWNGAADLTISTPGNRRPRLHAGRVVGGFACPSVAAGHLYRIAIDETADLAPIAPGARLQTTRVETTSDLGRAPRQWRAGSIAYRRFVRPSTAWARVFKRIPIIDETAAPQPRKSVSFASLTRLRVPAHTADVNVDIPGKGCRLGTFAAVRCAGLHALPSVAADRIKPAFSAISAAKRLSDDLWINTNLHRPLTAGTSLFAGTTYRAGQWSRA